MRWSFQEGSVDQNSAMGLMEDEEVPVSTPTVVDVHSFEIDQEKVHDSQ